MKIINAYENNLKNLTFDLNKNKIIGITGVSGSGKSTLAKLIAKYGYENYIRLLPNMIKNEILDNNNLLVDAINELQATIFIDIKNTISNPKSTLSTVTGIHNMLRNIYDVYGNIFCGNCNSLISNDIFDFINNLQSKFHLSIEFEISNSSSEYIKEIENYCIIDSIDYYNSSKEKSKKSKSNKYCTVNLKISNSLNIKKLAKKIKDNLGLHLILSLPKEKISFDVEENIICPNCFKIYKKKTKKSFSFNIPYSLNGGECRTCNGNGLEFDIPLDKLISDKNKSIISGGLEFINEKGIKNTKITEKFLEALGKEYNFSLNTLIKDLTDEQLKILIYGSNKKIKFKDRIGGNKEEFFYGLKQYVINIFLTSKSKDKVSKYILSKMCTSCNGTRLDKDTEIIKIFDTSLNNLMLLSISDLKKLLCTWQYKTNDPIFLNKINKIINLLNIYEDVDCGYLNLFRQCTTLSGGELQRLRIGRFLSYDISNCCVILDEPTCGLHPKDVLNLAKIITKIRNNQNTVLIVEHNKYLLQYCDYILDLGPYAGNSGGEILFYDELDNLSNYNTATSKYLTNLTYNNLISQKELSKDLKWLTFENLNSNNLKNLSFKLPLNQIVSICGVSGSGKSTFINMEFIKKLKYDNIKFLNLSQKNSLATENSSVLTLLDLSLKIPKIFNLLAPTLDKTFFNPNSKNGKCHKCFGKGYLSTDNYKETCDECSGLKFSNEVLKIKLNNKNINEILDMPLSELIDYFNDSKIKMILKTAIDMGLGYLNLNRNSKTLSKGESQRLKLVNLISENIKNYILILDEPTKGLHNSDIENFYNILNNIKNNNNSIFIIEHNINFIVKSDYIIEFGPKAGIEGGYLLYQGVVAGLLKSQTPTSAIFKNINNTISINKTNSNYNLEWHLNQKEVSIKRNEINILNISDDLAKSIIEENSMNYLKLINPNLNYVYEDKNKNLNLKNTSVIRFVDFKNNEFKKGMKLLELTTLDKVLANIYYKNISDNKNLSADLFNLKSKYGKCNYCEGSGKLKTFNLNHLMEDGSLTNDTIKFLKNSTNYLDIIKPLKNNFYIDLTQKYSEMSTADQLFLLYGDKEKKVTVNGKIQCWEGLIKLVYRMLKYYPNKNTSTQIKKGLKDETCIFCNGNLIKADYNTSKFINKNFIEFATTPIKDLSILLSNLKSSEYMINKLKNIVDLLVKYNLGAYTLLNDLKDLSPEEAAIVKTLAYTLTNIEDSVLIFNEITKVGYNLINELGITNTIIILYFF